MNTKELFHAFNAGLFWNGSLYFAYRLSSLALSLVLFTKLDSIQYCSWTTSMSCIYLTLAWLDCGLKKSVTRYSHVFTSSARVYGFFVLALIAFQLPVLTFVGPWLFKKMTCAISGSTAFAVYLIPLLLTEGLISIFKILFHAQFFIKQFNVLGFSLLIFRTMIVIASVWYGIAQPIPLLYQVHLITNIITLLCAPPLLYYLSMKSFLSKKELVSQKIGDSSFILVFDFVRHSVIMWSTSLARTLSERNFLIPLFSVILGPFATANFKVSNDIALLAQRLLAKTIGTTDTALLATCLLEPGKKHLLPVALKHIIKSLLLLSVPCMIIILVCSYYAPKHATLALLLASFYLIQNLLTPFERYSEVTQRYGRIYMSYIPYSVMLIYFYLTPTPHFSLITLLVIVHCARLSTLILMALFTAREIIRSGQD